MNKKLILTMVFTIMLIALITTTVQANYQSIGTGKSATTTATTWITGIRQMESVGQGMGLNETIDTTTALSTSGSNNIDVHMAKNTEYGTALLLGASDYGKQGYTNSGDVTGSGEQASTTGNKYGIYEMGYFDMLIYRNYLSFEWTAAGGMSFLTNIAPRYINRYSSEVEKMGDATISTKHWYGSSYAEWLMNTEDGFSRGNSGAFSYQYGYNSSDYYGRASVVCGTGF